MLIANPVSRGHSPSAFEEIKSTLSDEVDLEVHETSARGDAKGAASLAAADGFEVVAVFSGDGVINEAVNGLAGSEAALGVIPGGATNVLARNLGIPEDPAEASRFMLRRVLESRARRMNTGTANGRHFVINCGIGVDAALMARVEERGPRSRGSMERVAMFGAAAVAKSYVGKVPDLRVKIGDEDLFGVSVLIARTSPYAYFKNLELKIHAHGASLDGGFDVLTVKKLGYLASPRVVWEVLFGGRLPSHPDMAYTHDASNVAVVGTRSQFPVQLDGEYVGDFDALDVELARGAIWIIA
jgi:diacylglycerol kinase family enzyme